MGIKADCFDINRKIVIEVALKIERYRRKTKKVSVRVNPKMVVDLRFDKERQEHLSFARKVVEVQKGVGK
jgi:hypothetical protein